MRASRESPALGAASLLVVCTLPLLSACSSHELEWVFRDPGLGPAFIHAEIRRGRCLPGDPFYAQTFQVGTPAPSPGELDPGLHCFRGWALDANCGILGFAQVEVELPLDGPLTLAFVPMMGGSSPAGAVCRLPTPDGSTGDGGVIEDLEAPRLIGPHVGLHTNALSSTLPQVHFASAAGADYYLVDFAAPWLPDSGMEVRVESTGARAYAVPIPTEGPTPPANAPARLDWNVRACNASGCRRSTSAVNPYIVIGGQRSDLDGDGRADVVGLDMGGKAHMLISLDGATWEPVLDDERCAATLAPNAGVAAADLDSDGLAEIYVGIPSCDGTSVVFRCSPLTGLACEPMGLPLDDADASTGILLAAAGDTTGEGLSSLAVAARGRDQVILVSGSSIEVYPSPVPIDWLGAGADVDGDLLPDIVVSNRTQIFTLSGADPLIAAALALGVGDVDGDGTGDLLVAFEAGGLYTVELWGRDFETGERFTIGAIGDATATPVLAALGDVDGDGLMDVGAGLESSDGDPGYVQTRLSLYGPLGAGHPLGNGGGRFGAALAGGGDYDGDGIADIVVGAPGTGEVFVMTETAPDGLFWNMSAPPSPDSSAPAFGTAVAFGGI